MGGNQQPPVLEFALLVFLLGVLVTLAATYPEGSLYREHFQCQLALSKAETQINTPPPDWTKAYPIHQTLTQAALSLFKNTLVQNPVRYEYQSRAHFLYNEVETHFHALQHIFKEFEMLENPPPLECGALTRIQIANETLWKFKSPSLHANQLSQAQSGRGNFQIAVVAWKSWYTSNLDNHKWPNRDLEFGQLDDALDFWEKFLTHCK